MSVLMSTSALVVAERARHHSAMRLEESGGAPMRSDGSADDGRCPSIVWQACVSEHLHVLMGDDAGAAQQSISLLAKSIAERAAAIGLRKGDAGITTPFMQAAAEEGYDFRCGRWALERDDERDDERRHERGMDGRG